MSRKLNYNLNWLNSIYLNKIGVNCWMPSPKLGYRLYDLLNSDASLEEKSTALIGQLRDYQRTYARDFTAEQATNLWTQLRKALRRNRFVMEDKNGRRLLEAIIRCIDNDDYIDSEIIDVIAHIMKKGFASTNEVGNQEFDAAKAIIDTKFANLPPIQVQLRPTRSGWVETDEDVWPRFDRHDNKYMSVFKGFMKNNEINYGPEEEGTFPTKAMFEAACEKLSKTDFRGGKMYDQRWLCIPTNDPTIRNGFGVEWVFAPMCYEVAVEFQAKFLEILKEFGWDAEYSRHGSGIHCHIDANQFNDKTLMKLIDNTYDREHDTLRNFYGQESTYNSWRKSNCFRTRNDWVILKGQFTDDGEQLGVCRKIICSADRSTLINLQNMKRKDDNSMYGTVELRGFNGSKDMVEVINGIKQLVDNAIGGNN